MSVRILTGDCRDMLKTLPDASVHCCVTSPPYFGLRDYGHDGQIGLEQTPDAYVVEMVAVFAEVRRVLRDDGTVWLNLGDSYTAHAGQRKVTDKAGIKQQSNVASANAPSRHVEGLGAKNLLGIPWRVAFALQAGGWYLRQDIIWHKPNPMPESVQDRCTKAHEYVFLLSKSPRYFYDAAAIKEDGVKGFAGSEFHIGKTAEHQLGRASKKPRQAGIQHKQAELGQQVGGFLGSNDPFETRNKRSVWTIATQPFSEAHFATMAPELAETCIKAGCPTGGTVLDPFGGAGTTGLVADRLGRNALLIELNPEYVQIAHRRLSADAGMFAEVAA